MSHSLRRIRVSVSAASNGLILQPFALRKGKYLNLITASGVSNLIFTEDEFCEITEPLPSIKYDGIYLVRLNRLNTPYLPMKV